MASKIVRQYITQDLSLEEKKSYLEYINGNEKSTDWIEKGLIRREPLLLLQLTCSSCENSVSIRPNGSCKCYEGHECYDIVITAIKKIMSK
jgi:hypothetical protein